MNNGRHIGYIVAGIYELFGINIGATMNMALPGRKTVKKYMHGWSPAYDALEKSSAFESQGLAIVYRLFGSSFPFKFIQYPTIKISILHES